MFICFQRRAITFGTPITGNLFLFLGQSRPFGVRSGWSSALEVTCNTVGPVSSTRILNCFCMSLTTVTAGASLVLCKIATLKTQKLDRHSEKRRLNMKPQYTTSIQHLRGKEHVAHVLTKNVSPKGNKWLGNHCEPSDGLRGSKGETRQANQFTVIQLIFFHDFSRRRK